MSIDFPKIFKKILPDPLRQNFLALYPCTAQPACNFHQIGHISLDQAAMNIWRHIDNSQISLGKQRLTIAYDLIHIHQRLLFINVGIEPAESITGADGHFKGHVILDHERFTLIRAAKPQVKIRLDLNISDFQYSPHEIPRGNVKSRRITSPSDIASVIFDNHNSGDVILDLDNNHRVQDIRPFSIEHYDPMLFMQEMKENYLRNRIIVVSSPESFDRLQEKFSEYPHKQNTYKQPVLDCLYVNTTKGIYMSMLEKGILETLNWQGFLAKHNGDNSFTWNEDISDHPKQMELFTSEIKKKTRRSR